MVDIPLLPLGVASVVVLIGLSAFFSSSETAIFSLPVDELRESAAAGDERAVQLAEMREDPHRLLVTLLVGNNVVNVAISSIVTALLVESAFSTGVAVLLATVVASSTVLVLGEIVPKSYGLGNALAWGLRVAKPLRTVELLLFPLVVVFDVATRRLSALLGGDQAIEEPYVEERP